MKKLFLLFIASFLLVPGFILAQEKEITLQDIFASRKFYPRGVNDLSPMNDGETYCMLEGDSINVYNFESGDYLKTLV